jgi:2-amino-4-hydroxy-6-hydroxymethyldihydropteridine diphosphokinase
MNYPGGIISFIGIGSNQGDPLARCLEALEGMAAIEGCKILRGSSFYRTEPVGFLEQEWFVNAVIEMRTALSVQVLMKELQAIEARMGRQKQLKWGPRIIDLDILLYGQEVISDGSLTIPHPELHKRRFALEPLYEIAPYVIHPAFGVSMAGLMGRLEDTSKVEILKEGQSGRCL